MHTLKHLNQYKYVCDLINEVKLPSIGSNLHFAQYELLYIYQCESLNAAPYSATWLYCIISRMYHHEESTVTKLVLIILVEFFLHSS